MEMSKFGSIEDPGFVAVCGELRRWIRALPVVGGADADAEQTEQRAQELCT